jgi:repressor LexA
MSSGLTEKQELILNFIRDYRDQNGYPPTLREIGIQFSIASTFGVKRHLDALVKKGFIIIESNASRGIKFVKNQEEEDNLAGIRRIPVIGRVAAGTPILAMENIEGSIVIDPQLTGKSGNCFALKVKGDSMINAGIFEGDLVIVSPQNNALNNEIIVARIEDEVTVKRFELKNKRAHLMPENDTYKPIDVTDKESFSVVGKVIGVLRWMN